MEMKKKNFPAELMKEIIRVLIPPHKDGSILGENMTQYSSNTKELQKVLLAISQRYNSTCLAYNSLSVLDLSHLPNISSNDFKNLSDCISHVNTIETVNLRNLKLITDSSFLYFLERNTNVTNLSLETNLKLTEFGLANLKNKLINLEVLFIKNLSFFNEEIFFDLIQNLKNLKNLSLVDLKYLKEVYPFCFSSGDRSKPNLEYLRFTGQFNVQLFSALKCIGNSFSETLVGLRLNFDKSQEFKQEFRLIQKNLKNLKELWIDDTYYKEFIKLLDLKDYFVPLDNSNQLKLTLNMSINWLSINEIWNFLDYFNLNLNNLNFLIIKKKFYFNKFVFGENFFNHKETDNFLGEGFWNNYVKNVCEKENFGFKIHYQEYDEI
ncbi:hypothetical protein HK099_008627 [Clydaea vesicula]|uniref:Uncharacterized protein n=1 Tax=Clydaea vesicula TaxID=447962 RepID=A0AAD5Y1U9_9FUNG|nr:hypothetical protein HK099_008627 [Clydaea vesicula]